MDKLKLHTPVNFPLLDLFQGTEPCLIIGSCFSENIGERLNESGFNVVINPFGILYHPEAIITSLHCMLEGKEMTKDELVYHNGLYHSMLHHGSFSGSEPSAVLKQINSQLQAGRRQLFEKNAVLLITWGTAIGYRYNQSQKTVGNCHKMPAAYFSKFMSNADEIVIAWNSLINRLKQINPSIQLVFTISPVRHIADGLVENQLSKSILISAVHKLNNTHYFPAYELLMDELRDYRFYADDLIHPSTMAVEIIWQRFCNFSMTEVALQQVEAIQKFRRNYHHRIMHRTPQALSFLQKTLSEAENLSKSYPHADLSAEIAHLKQRIDNFENGE